MKDYRLVDWATQAYLVLVGGLILLFHGDTVPLWPWLVGAHAVAGLLVHALIRAESRGQGGAVVRFLRAFYPILLFTGLYRETGLVNVMFIQGYMDPLVMRWDQAIFGFQPSLALMEWAPQRWVSEVMYGCYFSYYFMIAGVGLALLIRNRRQFDHFVTLVAVIFYCCYLTYVVLPVMGPRVFYHEGSMVESVYGDSVKYPRWGVLDEDPPAYPESVKSGFFFKIVAFLYRYFESEGAALPSSHVALALVTLYFSWIYLPRIRWLHLMLAVGLCIGTVYCRFHYVVDVMGGVLVAWVLVPLANRLYFSLGGQVPDASKPPS